MYTVRADVLESNEELNKDLERILLRIKEITDSVIKMRRKYILVK